MSRSSLPNLVRSFAAILLLALPQAVQAQPGSASLEITVTGIKSAKGVIRLALCPPDAGFPDCRGGAVRALSVPIVNGVAKTTLTGLLDGAYAVSLFHDVNANGKLDTFAGIPKEGFGFSRNPPVRPRAPKWGEAVIQVAGTTSAAIRLRYIF